MSTTAFPQLARESAEREERNDIARALPVGLRQPWSWLQPRSLAEILQRLEDARSLNVPARERENMCSVAHGTITRLAVLLGQAERNLREDNRVALADAIAEALK